MSQRRQSLLSSFLHLLKNISMPSSTSAGSIRPNGDQSIRTPDAELKVESILIEEYRHMSNLAIQTLQERTSTFNVYFVLIGTIVSGLVVTFQFVGNVQKYTQIVTFVLFLFLAGMHFLFFERFLSLRRVYYESLLSMEMIREVYIKRFQHQLPELERVIRARKNFNAPASFHPGGGLVCTVMALSESGSLAVAIVIGYELVSRTNNGQLLPLPSTIFLYIFALLIDIVILVTYKLRYKRYSH